MKKVLAWIAVVLLVLYVLTLIGWLIFNLSVDLILLFKVAAFITIPVAGFFGLGYLLRETK
jgi:hypothetical protein